MSLGILILIIYMGLTLLATAVGYAACAASSHSDKTIKRAGNSLGQFAVLDNQMLSDSGAQDKRWAMSTR